MVHRFFDTGLDYRVTNDLVLDLRVGVSLTPDSDDFFTGVGGCCRFGFALPAQCEVTQKKNTLPRNLFPGRANDCSANSVD